MTREVLTKVAARDDINGERGRGGAQGGEDKVGGSRGVVDSGAVDGVEDGRAQQP